MDSLRSGTRWVVGGRRGPILRSQAKEGRGSPDDDNHRHRPCHKIKKERYKKREAIAPLFLFFNLLKVVLQNIFTITRIQVFPDSIRNPFARMTITNDSETNLVSFHHNQANMNPLVKSYSL